MMSAVAGWLSSAFRSSRASPTGSPRHTRDGIASIPERSTARRYGKVFVHEKNSFQLVALASQPFESLFRASDSDLEARGARKMVADEKPGFPCRVSLADAEVGETVVLLSYTHHDVDSPYRGSGPIFVRAGARTAQPAAGEIPAMFLHRLLSVRAYDDAAMMVGAEVVEGTELEAAIRRLFSIENASYLHIHNARPGCFNCKVIRA